MDFTLSTFQSVHSINLNLTPVTLSGCGEPVGTKTGWWRLLRSPPDRSLQVLYPPRPTNYGGMARTHLDFIHISLAGPACPGQKDNQGHSLSSSTTSSISSNAWEAKLTSVTLHNPPDTSQQALNNDGRYCLDGYDRLMFARESLQEHFCHSNW